MDIAHEKISYRFKTCRCRQEPYQLRRLVELEEAVNVLVISDLSWTKKIRHPGEVVKKGDKLDVIVLSVDIDQRRISLL